MHLETSCRQNTDFEWEPFTLYNAQVFDLLVISGTYTYTEMPQLLGQKSPSGLGFFVPEITRSSDLLVLPRGKTFLCIPRPILTPNKYQFVAACTIFVKHKSSDSHLCSHKISYRPMLNWIESLQEHSPHYPGDSAVGEAGH